MPQDVQRIFKEQRVMCMIYELIKSFFLTLIYFHIYNLSTFLYSASPVH